MASQDALSSRPLGARQDSQPSQEDQDLDDRDDDDRNSPEPKKRPAGRALLPRLDLKSQRQSHDDGMSLTVPEAIASECHTHTVPPIAIEGGARPSRSRGRSLSLTLFERTCFPPFAIEGAISVPHTQHCSALRSQSRACDKLTTNPHRMSCRYAKSRLVSVQILSRQQHAQGGIRHGYGCRWKACWQSRHGGSYDRSVHRGGHSEHPFARQTDSMGACAQLLARSEKG